MAVVRALGAGVVLAAAIGLAPRPSFAQAPAAANPDSNLLAPSLENAPNNPPPFRLPGEAAPPNYKTLPPGTVTAQSRIGATPTYGSPTGFGAGDTGFEFHEHTALQKTKETGADARDRRRNASRDDIRTGTKFRAARTVATAGRAKAADAGDLSEESRATDRRHFAAVARRLSGEQSAA